MGKDIKYTLQRKKDSILPRCLTRWELVVDNLDIEGVRRVLKENIHNMLLRLKQTRKATVLEYEQSPHYSAEEYDERRHGTLFNSGGPLEYTVLYRVMPPVRVSFEDER